VSALAFFWFIIAASESARRSKNAVHGSINIERSTTTARGYYQLTDPNFSCITRKLLHHMLQIDHFFPCISLPPMQRYWGQSLGFVLILRSLIASINEEFSALMINHVSFQILLQKQLLQLLQQQLLLSKRFFKHFRRSSCTQHVIRNLLDTLTWFFHWCFPFSDTSRTQT